MQRILYSSKLRNEILLFFNRIKIFLFTSCTICIVSVNKIERWLDSSFLVCGLPLSDNWQ